MTLILYIYTDQYLAHELAIQHCNHQGKKEEEEKRIGPIYERAEWNHDDSVHSILNQEQAVSENGLKRSL